MPVKTSDVAEALRETLISPNVGHSNFEPANVVDALDSISASLRGIAKALHALGNADASTPMGAIEAFGAVVEESADKLAGGLHAIAEAISDSNRKD